MTTRIHIDQKPIHCPTPTPAVELYELVQIPEGRALFKELTGNVEDELVRIEAQHVHLVQDDHFHTGDYPRHVHLIYVNTNPFFVNHDQVSFEEVVRLAFPTIRGGLDPEFTVSYEHAKTLPHHDDLTKGRTVTIKKHGTIFDVAHTNRS